MLEAIIPHIQSQGFRYDKMSRDKPISRFDGRGVRKVRTKRGASESERREVQKTRCTDMLQFFNPIYWTGKTRQCRQTGADSD